MKQLMWVALLVSLTGCNKTTVVATTTSTKTGEKIEKRLSLVAADAQTINRGGNDKVTVMINRDNFDDPVTVTFSDLPKGIAVAEKELLIATGKNTVTANLVADKDAAQGEHMVTITAKAPGMEENVQKFKLTVK